MATIIITVCCNVSMLQWKLLYRNEHTDARIVHVLCKISFASLTVHSGHLLQNAFASTYSLAKVKHLRKYHIAKHLSLKFIVSPSDCNKDKHPTANFKTKDNTNDTNSIPYACQTLARSISCARRRSEETKQKATLNCHCCECFGFKWAKQKFYHEQ